MLFNVHHPPSTIHLFLRRPLVSFPVASLPSPFITSAPVLTEDRARAGGREPRSRPPRNTQISRARALPRRPKSEREREIAGGNPSSSVSAVSPSNARSRFQRSFRHLCLLLCALSMVAMGGSAEVRRKKKAGRPRRLCADVASRCFSLSFHPCLPFIPHRRETYRDIHLLRRIYCLRAWPTFGLGLEGPSLLDLIVRAARMPSKVSAPAGVPGTRPSAVKSLHLRSVGRSFRRGPDICISPVRPFILPMVRRGNR